MSSVVLLLLVLSSHLVLSYNIDTAKPVVYKDPDHGRSNYFGYSVALRRSKVGKSPSSYEILYKLFVGAPLYSNGTGRVYRCTQSQCQAFKIHDGRGPTPRWLGASMAAGEFPDLTVCAPHSLYRYQYDDLLMVARGTCYDVKDDFSSVPLITDRPTSRYGFSTVHGFSVNYVTTKNAASNLRSTRIIGRPGERSVVITDGWNREVEQFDEADEVGDYRGYYFGYSVTSGDYHGSNELLYAVGAPAWLRKGMVVLFGENGVNGGASFMGSVPGEYFGASLATGDFDGDGSDDLAIGAPHWGDVDFGRVYTYHKTTWGIRLGRKLTGTVGNAQLGYTLATADLDRDGYSDLIVGAPWENSGAGAVYIYYGRRDFHEENPSAQIIQRIDPSAFAPSAGIKRFGFSLSQPVDIDHNGYPDLAIGAYKSGHAVVLRSKPVINTKMQIFSLPSVLQTTNNDFTVRVCVMYDGKGAPDVQDLSFDMTVDARYNRAVKGSMQKFDGRFRRGKPDCIDRGIALHTREGRNNVDPIMIDVTHSIKKGVDQGKIDPVLDRRSSISRTSLTVPINTKCRNFTACHAVLQVDAKFGNLGKDNVWVVGSGDISVSFTVSNEDEPAYNTQITIELPAPGIRIRNSPESCKTAPDTLSLTCDVGNPLVKERPTTFDIDLDMSNIDTRSAGALVPYLTFNVTKSTRSIDKAATTPIPPLQLNIKHDADVNLSGMASKKQIDYRRIAKNTKISVQHFYQVRKFGLSPITEAYLNVDVPTSMIGKNVPFLNISDSTLTDSYGAVQNCHINEARSVNHTGERKRRGNPGGDDETLVTSGSTATDGIPKPDNKLSNNGDDEEKTIARSMAGRTIYLNCSTEGILCTRFTCGFVFPESHEAVENFVLDMTFNATSFYASDEESVNIKIRTDASVDVRRPLIPDSTEMRNWTASAMTMLYSIPEPKKLAGWIIPVSIIFGILLFCLAAFIMYKVGFFNRSKKLETAKARDGELILDANNADNIEHVNPDVDAIGHGDDGP